MRRRTGQRVPYHTLLKRMHQHADSLGLPVTVAPHALRRSCTIELIRGGTTCGISKRCSDMNTHTSFYSRRWRNRTGARCAAWAALRVRRACGKRKRTIMRYPKPQSLTRSAVQTRVFGPRCALPGARIGLRGRLPSRHPAWRLWAAGERSFLGQALAPVFGGTLEGGDGDD